MCSLAEWGPSENWKIKVVFEQRKSFLVMKKIDDSYARVHPLAIAVSKQGKPM